MCMLAFERVYYCTYQALDTRHNSFTADARRLSGKLVLFERTMLQV